ncbi:MAG: hypothetical protein ACRETP_03120 [Steroidobacteraceae bacterium]
MHVIAKWSYTMNPYKPTVFAILVSAAVLSVSASMPAAADDEQDVIVGVWTCDGEPGPFKVIKTFAVEGTMMEIDNITFQESPTVGVWKRSSTLHYFLVARQFAFNPDGSWAGTYFYSQPLVMDPSRKAMTGTFHAQFVDPSGNSTDAGTGSVSCSRMTFSG